MKTDNYKNLCLAQALNSPLKYRHGCIIVKGGKVIGQGFNDVRSGFDGGALKTGQLPLAAAPRPVSPPGTAAAVAGGPTTNATAASAKSKNFTAFESIVGMGGGPLANTPLTMHSEMMAINSALSSSSTLAATTVSSLKPCYKLPGDTKRKRELRRGAVAAFVDRVCRAELEQGIQQGTASVQGPEWRFEASTGRWAGAIGDFAQICSSLP
ncbi:hypothetical protein PG996_008547 [Apiospora saccharicola]|uniref:CMP/dCMP-type deaminase domain-containing protein n=1 Tax=Apiospora saccharicola TaxID=335842 RepID=A0ABR1UYA8_9PEZI